MGFFYYGFCGVVFRYGVDDKVLLEVVDDFFLFSDLDDELFEVIG